MTQDDAEVSRPQPLGALFAWALAIALLLQLLQAMLFTLPGWGIEHFLGWKDAKAIEGITRHWSEAGTLVAAYAYLAADTLVFVPAYLLLFLRLAQVLGAAFGDVAQPRTQRAVQWLARGAAAAVFVLVAIDLVENLGGFARLGPVSAFVGVAITLAGIAVLRAVDVPQLRRLSPRRWWILLALAGVILAGLAAWQRPLVLLGAHAHAAKRFAILVTIFLPAALVAMWFSGAGLVDRRKAKRGRFRAAVGDMVVRSRYVLLALAILAGLTLVMDQARDVVYAMAANPFDELRKIRQPDARIDWGVLVLQVLGAVPAFVAATLALRAFVFTCWLWTRSVCQIQCAKTAALTAAAATTPTAETAGTAQTAQAAQAAQTTQAGGAADTADTAKTPESAAVALPTPRDYEDTFARLWARVLAVAPLLMTMLLVIGVVRDATPEPRAASGQADAAAWVSVVGVLVLFAVALLAFGRWFLQSRADRQEEHYYDCLEVADWWQRAGFGRRPQREDSKYAFARLVRAFWLPVVALIGMLACRLVDIFPSAWTDWPVDYVPTLALPAILFSLVAWLCFFGWLSLLEVRRSIPWVGVLVALVALLSTLGLTDNHLVWTGTGPRTPLLGMWLWMALLALLLLWAYAWAMKRVDEQMQAPAAPGVPAPTLLGAGRWRQPLAMVACLVAVVTAGQFSASHANRSGGGHVHTAAQRDAPELAMSRWLAGLCVAGSTACQPAAATGQGGGYPVYFVSTEGGGIRAAAWTAYVLDQLLAQDPQFLLRTFSISGVSGGSVGAAVFRACHLQTAGAPDQRRRCLKHWAETDHLSPLLGAWMFEDALARVVTTRPCSMPGCGFLSRASWFERSFEAAVPKMADGLAASRGGTAAPHLPYLLLNATWVETGERAIASDLLVPDAVFPAARDQLALAGGDLSLTTAAHNSARFPYTNAIGTLPAQRGACEGRAGAPLTGKDADKVAVCGHLADGGYFDNSGAQSTRDVLHLFQRCLTVQEGDADAARYAACLGMPEGQRKLLRLNLVPQVLMIRNGVPFTTPQQQASCPPQDSGVEPTALEVRGPEPVGCGVGNGYRPDLPICAAPARTLVELTGPPMTLLNVSGIRSNGRLPHARQEEAVRNVRLALGTAQTGHRIPAVVPLDLVLDGARYPLGWHLSPRAREGIVRQVAGCRAGIADAPALALPAGRAAAGGVLPPMAIKVKPAD